MEDRKSLVPLRRNRSRSPERSTYEREAETEGEIIDRFVELSVLGGEGMDLDVPPDQPSHVHSHQHLSASRRQQQQQQHRTRSGSSTSMTKHRSGSVTKSLLASQHSHFDGHAAALITESSTFAPADLPTLTAPPVDAVPTTGTEEGATSASRGSAGLALPSAADDGLDTIEDVPRHSQMSSSLYKERSDDVEAGIKEAHARANVSFLWMLLSLVSHTGWGIYPVLGRFLQVHRELPPMSLLAAGNAAVAIVTGIIVFRRGRFLYIVRGLVRTLPVLILVTLCRTITNLLAPAFVNAIFVQLVTLSVPFIVAMFNKVLLHEDLPPWSVPAIIATSVGAALMLFSSMFPFSVSLDGTGIVGITLAGVSACFLALYMMLVRKATAARETSVPGDELLFFLTGPVVLVGASFMLVMDEDLSPWARLDWRGWLAFVGFAGGVLLMSNILQISAIRALGAPTVSGTIAMRLVATLIFSAIVLGEVLNSITQLIGAFVVLVSITWYLWMQRNYQRQREVDRAERERAIVADNDSDSDFGVEGDGLRTTRNLPVPMVEISLSRARSTSV